MVIDFRFLNHYAYVMVSTQFAQELMKHPFTLKCCLLSYIASAERYDELMRKCRMSIQQLVYGICPQWSIRE